MIKKVFLVLLMATSTAALGAPSTKENILTKEKGFFGCSGSSSGLLFKQDCLELKLDRISFGGNIVYEATCLDPNGKKFLLSCANFTFEPDAIASEAKKNYFDK